MNYTGSQEQDNSLYDDMDEFFDSVIDETGGFSVKNTDNYTTENIDVVGNTPKFDQELVNKFYSKLEELGYNLDELKQFLECDDNMLVLACAGAGKTTGLILKIIFDMLTGMTMKYKDVPDGLGGIRRIMLPCNILVSTFLKTGAEELEQSFKEWCMKLNIVGIDFSSIKFRTLHSEVYNAIKDMGFPISILMDTNAILRESMTYVGVRSVMANSRNVTADEVNDVACIVTYARNRLDEKRYEHSLMSDYNLDRLTLDLLLKDFDTRRKASGQVDFEDMQEILYNGLISNPNVAEFIANRYDCIYIDEFQDTSQLQYELIKFYTKKARKIVAIGDDDQCLVGGTLLKGMYEDIKICDITEGVSIKTATGSSKSGVFTVDRVSKRENTSNIIQITTESGKVLKATEGHIGFVLNEEANCTAENLIKLTMYAKADTNAVGLSKSTLTVKSTSLNVAKLAGKCGLIVDNTDSETFEYSSLNIDELEYLGKTFWHSFKDNSLNPTMIKCAKLDNSGKDYLFTRFCDLEVGMSVPVDVDGTIVADKIIGIVTLDPVDFVYDLSVPATRNFVANGVVVHNCIYSWRGSDINIISEIFEADYKPTVVKLTTNYRCASNILQAVIPSIVKNTKRHDKSLRAFNQGGELKIVKDSNVNYLLESVKQDLAKWGSVGILARTNADLLIPAILLELDGTIKFSLSKSVSLNSRLPRQVFGLIDLLTKRHTPGFENMFKLFLSKYDSYQAERLDTILRTNKQLSIFNIPLKDLQYSVPKLAPMISGLRQAVEKDKVLGFIYLLELMKSQVYTGQSIYAQKARMFVDFVKKLIIEHKDLQKLDINELDSLFNDVLQSRLEKRIRLSKATAIKLTTVHEAKGKEWDSVYIWNDIDGCFPNSVGNRELTLDEFEEERRVHYIAWTRPKKKLTVFTSSGLMSKFLSECDLSNEGVVEENNAKIEGNKIVHKKMAKEDVALVQGLDYEKIFREYIVQCDCNVNDMSNLEIVMAQYSVADIAKMLENDVKLEVYPSELWNDRIKDLMSELSDMFFESLGGTLNE